MTYRKMCFGRPSTTATVTRSNSNNSNICFPFSKLNCPKDKSSFRFLTTTIENHKNHSERTLSNHILFPQFTTFKFWKAFKANGSLLLQRQCLRQFEIFRRQHGVERGKTKHVVATNTRIFPPKCFAKKIEFLYRRHCIKLS